MWKMKYSTMAGGERVISEPEAAVFCGPWRNDVPEKEKAPP